MSLTEVRVSFRVWVYTDELEYESLDCGTYTVSIVLEVAQQNIAVRRLPCCAVRGNSLAKWRFSEHQREAEYLGEKPPPKLIWVVPSDSELPAKRGRMEFPQAILSDGVLKHSSKGQPVCASSDPDAYHPCLLHVHLLPQPDTGVGQVSRLSHGPVGSLAPERATRGADRQAVSAREEQTPSAPRPVRRGALCHLRPSAPGAEQGSVSREACGTDTWGTARSLGCRAPAHPL